METEGVLYHSRGANALTNAPENHKLVERERKDSQQKQFVKQKKIDRKDFQMNLG